MRHAEPYTAQFDEVRSGGRIRATVGVEIRDRETDGSVPTEAWFRGEEYRLESDGGSEPSVYVRRL
ncbi:MULTISPECIES: hypothetical protein [Microbacterium]|uniref:hypothetical protein n=1 Tax=Microbacterium TaxID=33882 RepID=UPI00146D6D6A|nr:MULTISPECIES: hypothetical protein [Microbacterium]